MSRDPQLSITVSSRGLVSRSAWALRAALLLTCTLGATNPAVAAGKSAEDQRIQALESQLQAVQRQLKQLADQNQSLLQHQQQIEQQLAQQQVALQQAQHEQSAAVAAQSALPGPSSALPGPAAATPAGAPSAEGQAATPGGEPASFGLAALENLRLWGYGELYYNRPSRDTARTQADLARAVFGIGYRFDDRTEFNSEYEVEHAVASADDPGEFEVEQFYVDHLLTERIGLRAGLFLLPFGMLNEHHEPTNFYGVQRNFIETLIIPSTWREGGLAVHGDTEIGLSWNAGVTTGFDLAKWEFAPEFPTFTTALELEDNDVAPLQATHQELALANGRNLSQYVSLSYVGVPGLNVGGAVFTGKAAPAPGTVGDSRVTLWEGHARWTPGKFDLSALYAHGSISNVADANLANPGSPNPIPSAFYGYFAQAAYGAWEHGDYRLNPFVRWEYFDMGSQYSGRAPMIPTGSVPLSDAPGDFGLWPQNRDRVWTVGANFYVTPHVVFKADYQWFDINSQFNRLDLGLGLSF
ncbi:MAG TPA: porin [Steroidobacteraceae bacterium]|nr:porin [Steroidobacteraceae bacterium]